MLWVWGIVIVVVIGVVVVVAVGRGDAMGEVYDDRPDSTIPTGRALTADDLRDLRFSTAVRGYRMDEVDALLARVQADLLGREQREPSPTVETAANVESAPGGPQATADSADEGSPQT